MPGGTVRRPARTVRAPVGRRPPRQGHAPPGGSPRRRRPVRAHGPARSHRCPSGRSRAYGCPDRNGTILSAPTAFPNARARRGTCARSPYTGPRDDDRAGNRGQKGEPGVPRPGHAEAGLRPGPAPGRVPGPERGRKPVRARVALPEPPLPAGYLKASQATAAMTTTATTMPMIRPTRGPEEVCACGAVWGAVVPSSTKARNICVLPAGS